MINSHLSIQQLLLVISDRKLKEELEQLVLDAESKCKFARVWRNKQIAHSDLDIVLEREVKALPGIRHKQVEQAIDAVHQVIDHIHQYYFQPQIMSNKILTTSGAENLIYYLELVVKYEEQRQKRLEQGRFLPEDFDLPPTGVSGVSG